MIDGPVVVRAPLWRWSSEKGGAWYFVTIAGEPAAELRLAALGMTGGFGSIKVTAQIGDTRWQTSVFPHKEAGGFILPVKAAVRRAAGLVEGMEAEFVLRVGAGVG